MRKLFATGVTVGVLCLMLGGCASSGEVSEDEWSNETASVAQIETWGKDRVERYLVYTSTELPTGETVQCVVYLSEGGVSCDWEHLIPASIDNGQSPTPEPSSTGEITGE